MVIGLISDTHGELRATVHSALAGVELILHAGDVGGDDILDELALIAPVHAVAGNCDDVRDPRLHDRLERTFGNVRVHVSHGHELGAPTPERLVAAYDADVIVYGHTHRSRIERIGGRLVVNPGAAGPRRFDLEPSCARLRIDGSGTHVELVVLD